MQNNLCGHQLHHHGSFGGFRAVAQTVALADGRRDERSRLRIGARRGRLLPRTFRLRHPLELPSCSGQLVRCRLPQQRTHDTSPDGIDPRRLPDLGQKRN